MSRHELVWAARILKSCSLMLLFGFAVMFASGSQVLASEGTDHARNQQPAVNIAAVTPSTTVTPTVSPTATKTTAAAAASPSSTTKPSATPTTPAAKTSTPSRTPSKTPSATTAALSSTPSRTPSATSSLTSTVQVTRTATRSVTPSRTPTITLTSTISGTGKITPTSTVSGTRTITPTGTITGTRTVTATNAVEADIDPVSGGKLSKENGAIVFEFPAQMTDKAIRAKIHRTVTDVRKDDRGGTRVFNRFVAQAFDKADLKKEVNQFKKNVKITIKYDPKTMPIQNERDLVVVYWDPSKKQWGQLASTVDPKTKTITALTNHFTDFGLSEAPQIENYIPNLKGFQTDLFTGAANASYDLDVPPGRGGLAPNLGLDYSSSSVDMTGSSQQASFVGNGWRFASNYIARDHRNSDTVEDDMYTLVLNGAGYDLAKDANDPTRYHTANEQYWYIKQVSEDTWKVTTTDGTKYTFGLTANSRAQGLRGPMGSAYLQLYAWWLEKIEDTHGNTINYTYQHDSSSFLPAFCWAYPIPTYDRAIYPQVIQYNGGLTRIQFYYSSRSDYGIPGSSGCVPLPQQTLKLDRVEISTSVGGQMQLVRKYEFVTDYSTFTGINWDHGDGTGGSGRLTLRNIKQYGTDGSSTLPFYAFGYEYNRLKTAENGIGGKTTYNYTVTVAGTEPDPVSWSTVCNGEPNCNPDWGGANAYVAGEGGASMWVVGGGGCPCYVAMNLGQYIPGTKYNYYAVVTGNGENPKSVRLSVYDGANEMFVSPWYYNMSSTFWIGGEFTTAENRSGPFEIRIHTQNYAQIQQIRIDTLNTRHVVTTKTVEDGNGNVETYNYTYSGAAVNDALHSVAAGTSNPRVKPGVEFRGHQIVTVTIPSVSKTENWFRQEDFFAGRAMTITQMDANNNKFTRTRNEYSQMCIPVVEWLSGTASKNSCNLSGTPTPSPTPPSYNFWVATGQKAYYTYLNSTTKDTYDGQASPNSQKTVYAYSWISDTAYSINLPSVITQTEYSDGGSYPYRSTVQSFNLNTTPSVWIVNKAFLVQTKDATGQRVSESQYYYDNTALTTTIPISGELRKIDVFTDSLHAFTAITNTYDQWGNLIYYDDALNHRTTTTYDGTYHIFPTNITNALSQATTNAFDYRLGKLSYTIDPNGAKTSYAYDVFGRTSDIWLPLEHDGNNQPPASKSTVHYCYSLGSPRSHVQAQVRRDLGGTNTPSYQTAWWFYDGLGRVIQRQAEAQTAGQTILANTSYNNLGQLYRTSNPYTVTTPTISCQASVWTKQYFEQNGLVVMEAERYDTAVSRNNQSWVAKTDVSGYAGDSAMRSEPENGSVNNTGYLSTSPELRYPINFSTTGTYYVWVRAWAPDSGGNSVHVGLDGQETASSDRISADIFGSWFWTRDTLDGAPATINVTTAGVHTINVWMREDGFRLDRLLLTRDSGYTPSGSGPAESSYTSNADGYLTPSWDGAHPYTQHQYDAMGRELVTTFPAGNSQSMTYEPWKMTVIDGNGNRRVNQTDGFGRTLFVSEKNSSQSVSYQTSYSYDELDHLKFVTDSVGYTTTISYDQLGRKTSMTDPDMGTWNYRYDRVGNLLEQTDPKHQRTCFYYDVLNRLRGKNYQSDSAVCPISSGTYTIGYTYDSTATGNKGVGRRTGMTDPSGSASWLYDLQGRVLTTTKSINGAPTGSYSTGWTYDAMSRVRTMTYPDGERVDTNYNNQGLISSLNWALGGNNGQYINSANYYAAGQLQTLNYNSGQSTNYAYDANLRLTQLTTAPSGGAAIQGLTYRYDDVSNVKSITDTVRSEASQFNYDFLNRLIDVNAKTLGGATIYTQTWGYTSTGNILSQSLNGIISNYAYDPAHKHAATQMGSNTYSYDPNGNMIYRAENGGTYYQAWDPENRLSAVISDTMSIHMISDGDGARVRKTEYANQSATFSDSFDSSNPSAWTYNAQQTVPFNDSGQNVLRNTGTGSNWNAGFSRNAGIVNGQSASIDFKVSNSAIQSGFVINTNDGGTWSVFGLSLSNQVGTLIYQINSGGYVSSRILLNPVKANTWYRLTFRVDDTNGFKVEVRERDTTGAAGSFSVQMPAGKNWKFYQTAYNYITYVDNYVERTDSAKTTYYIGNHYEVATAPTSVTKYYYFGSQRVAMRQGSSVTYLHSDHLGSTSATSGATTSSQVYYPFGGVRASTGNVATDYGFTGQKLDASDGLMYYGARYYDAALGRFISADTIVPNPYNPQSLNRYAYVLNNPVKYTDPSGHKECGGGEPGDPCGEDPSDKIKPPPCEGTDCPDGSDPSIPEYPFWSGYWVRPGLGPVQFGPTKLHFSFFFADIYFSASGFGYKGSSSAPIIFTPTTGSITTQAGTKFTVGQGGTVTTSSPASSTTIVSGDTTFKITNSTVGGVQYDPKSSPDTISIVIGSTTTVTKITNDMTKAAGESSIVTLDIHPLETAAIGVLAEYVPAGVGVIWDYITRQGNALPGYTY